MSLRAWATPLIIGSFLIMAVSGVAMFFHVEIGAMKGVHEWAGLVMAAAGVAHVVLNWRAFTLYFKRPIANAIMAAGAVVLGLSAAISGEGASGNPVVAVMGAMGNARLEQLASLTGEEPGALAARLQAGGYAVTGPDETVGALAEGDRGKQGAILSAIFSTQQGAVATQ